MNLAYFYNWLSVIFLGYLAIWSLVSAGFSAVFKPFPLDVFLIIVYLALTAVLSFGLYQSIQIIINIRDYDGNKDDSQLITYAKISCIISVFTLLLIIGLSVSRKWGSFFSMWQLMG